jgi:hypothetical protein
MPQGLQVWAEDGSLKLDVTERLSRLIDQRTISGQGSVQIPALTGGTPFAFAVLDGSSAAPQGGFIIVTVTGNVLSWNVPAGLTATMISGLY